MTKMPTLHLPDFKLPFVVEIDASAVAVGAVLSQTGHPLAFFSKKMNPKLQASSVYVREMYAITEAVKRWRQYLIGQHFKIITDQKSLNTLLSQTIQTPEQQNYRDMIFKLFTDLEGKTPQLMLCHDRVRIPHSSCLQYHPPSLN